MDPVEWILERHPTGKLAAVVIESGPTAARVQTPPRGTSTAAYLGRPVQLVAEVKSRLHDHY